MTDKEDAELDKTQRYITDDGEERTFAQIAMASAKDPDVTVREADDIENGYFVNGTLFTPADDAPDDD